MCHSASHSACDIPTALHSTHPLSPRPYTVPALSVHGLTQCPRSLTACMPALADCVHACTRLTWIAWISHGHMDSHGSHCLRVPQVHLQSLSRDAIKVIVPQLVRMQAVDPDARVCAAARNVLRRGAPEDWPAGITSSFARRPCPHPTGPAGGAPLPDGPPDGRPNGAGCGLKRPRDDD